MRLIGPDLEALGVVPLEEAEARAARDRLRLEPFQPEADPPVYRLMDPGRVAWEARTRNWVFLGPGMPDAVRESGLARALEIFGRGEAVTVVVALQVPSGFLDAFLADLGARAEFEVRAAGGVPAAFRALELRAPRPGAGPGPLRG